MSGKEWVREVAPILTCFPYSFLTAHYLDYLLFYETKPPLQGLSFATAFLSSAPAAVFLCHGFPRYPPAD